MQSATHSLTWTEAVTSGFGTLLTDVDFQVIWIHVLEQNEPSQ